MPPLEVLEEESRRSASGHFNVIHHDTTMRADVYLPGDDALNAWAFAHPAVRQIEGDEVSLAPIEAVVLSKLRYYRMGRSDRLDRPELERWVAKLGVEREWRLAQDYQEPA